MTLEEQKAAQAIVILMMRCLQQIPIEQREEVYRRFAAVGERESKQKFSTDWSKINNLKEY